MAKSICVALLCTAFLIATACGIAAPAPAPAPGYALPMISTVSMPEPAPGPTEQLGRYYGTDEPADLLFILTADKATFTTPSTLVLSDVSHTAATFETGGRAGASPLDVFTSTAPGAPYVDGAGRWLSQPDALMKCTMSGHPADALLILSRPVLDKAAETLTFTVATLQASAPTVKFPGGAVSERVQQAGAGMGAPLIQTAAPGLEVTDVAIFIDMNREALEHPDI